MFQSDATFISICAYININITSNGENMLTLFLSYCNLKLYNEEARNVSMIIKPHAAPAAQYHNFHTNLNVLSVCVGRLGIKCTRTKRERPDRSGKYELNHPIL